MNRYPQEQEQRSLAAQAPLTVQDASTAIARSMERVLGLAFELQDTAARAIERFADVVVPFPVAGQEPTPTRAPEPTTSSMASRLRDLEQVLARTNDNLNNLIKACEL